MNIENVTNRFATLTGIDSEELSKWGTLIEDACEYVLSRCTVESPDSAQTRRLELLSAAYALKLYGMCGNEDLTQFVAGDVRLTLSADRREQADRLWDELVSRNADLIGEGGFLFGRVI